MQNGNVNLPVGTLYGDHRAFTLQANGQLTHASVYRPLIVAYRNGSPVRLEEIGKVLDSVQNNRVANWCNDTDSVVLAIQRQPGTNTVEVVDAVKQLLPQFRAIIPPSIEHGTLYDRVGIDSRVGGRCEVHAVSGDRAGGAGDFSIPAQSLRHDHSQLALPMSIIGTFAVMYVLDYTVDNLSLMALTLSVGFVVDDAIVMLENIVRHMEMGEGVMEAALSGSREIGFTIVSMTLSLAAVFHSGSFHGRHHRAPAARICRRHHDARFWFPDSSR